jgi:rare lipoprotein A
MHHLKERAMSRTWRQSPPLAALVTALALVAGACTSVDQRPNVADASATLHPLPPPRPVQPPAPPAFATVPPAAALAALEAARAQPRRTLLETGIASWYGPGFAGRPTASGELFDPQAMTAAHPALPLGAEVVVVNLANGREARLRINDRGPFVGDRVIDVSTAAAKALGFYLDGLAEVRVDLVTPPPDAAA